MPEVQVMKLLPNTSLHKCHSLVSITGAFELTKVSVSLLALAKAITTFFTVLDDLRMVNAKKNQWSAVMDETSTKIF
jgi:hypothetical protein